MTDNTLSEAVERIVRDHFYTGPMGGATQRLVDALIAEFPALTAGEADNATLQARIAELEGAAGEGRFSGLIDQAWDRLHRPEPDVPGAMVCLNAMKSAALRSTDTGEK
jgi:hypothetical protein